MPEISGTAAKRPAARDESTSGSPLGCFIEALTRKKPLDGRTNTSLNRCLTLLDLTTLGVGSTLGLGLYVLAGQVASTKAGPAVVISFALAALASAFSALCYSEFASRVPRAGSAYAYSYITTGEFVAFIIGWNLILEYVIGASSVARAFSGYLRFVFNHVMLYFQTDGGDHGTIQTGANTIKLASNATALLAKTLATARDQNLLVGTTNATIIPITNGQAAPLLTQIEEYVYRYFDWVCIAIVLVLTIFILFGVKESTKITLVFTGVNLSVVVIIVLSSIGSLDLRNWRLAKEELPDAKYGEGGFMPYGWAGVLAGSASCFFGFIGFDTVASSAEEAKNPRRNVPLSIVLSLFISFLAYMSISMVQTLLWPYYQQDSITILPYIFAQLNMPLTYTIVLIGAVAGLASSQLGAMYPLPRILYSMAQDKLIYASLSKVNRKLKLPIRATIVGSCFIAMLACLLDISDLADMVSIGTLAAYSLVSLSVLIIRYEDRSDAVDDSTMLSGRLSFQDILSVEGQGARSTRKDQISIFDKEDWKSTNDQQTKEASGPNTKAQQTSNINKWFTGLPDDKPTDASSAKSKVYIAIIVILTILLNLVVVALASWTPRSDQQQQPNERLYCDLRSLLAYATALLAVALVVVVYLLSKLPNSSNYDKQKEMFLVPFVPITPTLSILVNTFLMLNLNYLTWIRFTVWMAIGLFIYFSYGIWNSEGYFLHLEDEPEVDTDKSRHH